MALLWSNTSTNLEPALDTLWSNRGMCEIKQVISLVLLVLVLKLSSSVIGVQYQTPTVPTTALFYLSFMNTEKKRECFGCGRRFGLWEVKMSNFSNVTD